MQRVAALNRFLHDVYHEPHILNDGTVPAELVVGNSNFRPEMKGLDLPHGTYVSICGIDLVRDKKACSACSKTTRGRRRGFHTSSRIAI